MLLKGSPLVTEKKNREIFGQQRLAASLFETPVSLIKAYCSLLKEKSSHFLKIFFQHVWTTYQAHGALLTPEGFLGWANSTICIQVMMTLHQIHQCLA